MSFAEVPKDPSFPKLEEDVLAHWNRISAFEESLRIREGRKRFVFYDGPPFATGLPHYGHLLQSTLKDIVPRYWTMRGYRVERRFGWDTHGLPIEMEIEKDLGLKGAADIRAYGVDRFNEACRATVLRYAEEWRKTIGRLGRWVDFDNDYKTMTPEYMESVWWVFRSLYEKGLIYRGKKVMPYSWRLATPLSNFEAGLDYRSVQDPAVVVKFRRDGSANEFFLAWTTTPWTLPSNVGLAVRIDVDYVRVRFKDETHVLASARVDEVYKGLGEIEIVETLKGEALVGSTFEPILPYFADEKGRGSFRVIPGDFVTTQEGTGIVHMAPAFGEDDAVACQAAGIALVDPVDEAGRFDSKVPDFQGLFVKDADKPILQRLKGEGKVLRHDTIVHDYPYCWRSDTPLIYKAVDTWFVRVESLRSRLVANNAKIRWVPEAVGSKRFGKWLEGARDWAISRNRFWGTPIPIWRCQGCGDERCAGSRADLASLSGAEVTDLHSHRIDHLTWPCARCGQPMRRVSEVLDCWFESGAMPYAQNHYPFENKAAVEAAFPADFIGEALDQTRGWFYTLLVLSTALFDEPAFKNCIVSGLILAEDGSKMSKRKKNYPAPENILDTFGADALRAFLVNSPVMRGEPLRFSEAGVKDVVRSILLPLWNAYSFLVTYARTDGWSPPARALSDPSVWRPIQNELDRWVLSRLDTLLTDVNREMERYDLSKTVPALLSFIEDLTNWYIRRSRRRFWKSENDADKQCAFETLYRALTTITRALAPIIPFITEHIYRHIVASVVADAPASVHLTDYPMPDGSMRDSVLEHEMDLVQRAISLGRNLRNERKIRVRQPLPSLSVVAPEPHDRAALARLSAHIRDELNVKEVVGIEDETVLVTLSSRANFKTLGKRLGPRMNEVGGKLSKLTPAEIRSIVKGDAITIDGESFGSGDVVIHRTEKPGMVVGTDGILTVALDITVTDELRIEGVARELINRIQNMRKEAGLKVDDRIRLGIEGSPDVVTAASRHADTIRSEVLAIDLSRSLDLEHRADHDIDGLSASIAIQCA